jgi:1,4-alpha-glucan branching enzyme
MLENNIDLTSENQEVQPWFSLFSDFDIDLFKAGKHFHLYNKLGSHQVEHLGNKGTYFAVWAPNARSVSVIGDFNGWDRQANPMHVRWDSSGIWEVFVPTVQSGNYYKYFIEGVDGYQVEKGDPYAYQWETAPATATATYDITTYQWQDTAWLTKRAELTALNSPMSIYEVHLGSWKKGGANGDEFLTYRQLANELPAYCKKMGFTHIELMPVMEHPFYGSWGYQLTGYYAPTSRYGAPQDFMYLIDQLHLAGIGVILDWVPSHFPEDQHGLGYFDGTHLYEYPDPRKGYHPDWKSLIFNYCRNEVRAFLISNALFWLDKYHIDGLRVDAVASMLYLDYSRKEGEWIPNEYGGRENLEAISFIREFNDAVHQHHADVITIAEESTAWPGVTHPTNAGGLGFDLKWMMGWMHDTLDYFHTPPIYRRHNQVYAFSEKFVLPLSHDEVVYGKGALIDKMPGDRWQQFANLRLLYGYMFGHPGSKMIFMGDEFGQRHEWQHDHSLDWHENNDPLNNGVQQLLIDLNKLYTEQPALYEHDYSIDGFEWIDISDEQNSVISWTRKGAQENDQLLFIANFTPVVRTNYRVGVTRRGYYREVLNSDNLKYGGSDVLNGSDMDAYPIPMNGRTHSLSLTLPPLAVVVLKYQKESDWWIS